VWLSASEEPVGWKPTSWPLEKARVEPHLERGDVRGEQSRRPGGVGLE
jgi:hypothetical protein